MIKYKEASFCYQQVDTCYCFTRDFPGCYAIYNLITVTVLISLKKK